MTNESLINKSISRKGFKSNFSVIKFTSFITGLKLLILVLGSPTMDIFISAGGPAYPVTINLWLSLFLIFPPLSISSFPLILFIIIIIKFISLFN